MNINLKSIVLGNLPKDGIVQTDIIIDMFERFYRVPRIISLESEMSRGRLAIFSSKKREDMKKTLTAHFAPFLAAQTFCQELIQLDLVELAKFKSRWIKQVGMFLPKDRLTSGFRIDLFRNDLRDNTDQEVLLRNWGTQLKKLALELPGSGFKMDAFIFDWIDFYLKEPKNTMLQWEEIRDRFSATKGSLDNGLATVTELIGIVENFRTDVQGMDAFNTELASIEAAISRPEVRALDPISQKFLDDLRSLNDEREQTEHRIWISYRNIVLENLVKDISLVMNVDIDGWNPAIFREALCVIDFIMRMFDELEDKSSLPDHMRSEFEDCLRKVEHAWSSMHEKFLTLGAMFEEVTQKYSELIPAKTVQELYVLNALSQGVSQGRLIYDERCDHETLRSNILGVLRNLQGILASDEADDSKLKTDIVKTTQSRLELSWSPKMMAVVLDSETPFLMTGACRPACKDHFALGRLAKRMTHMQIGEEFNEHLLQCYGSFRDDTVRELRNKCEEIKKESIATGATSNVWSEEHLNCLFPVSGRTEVYNKLPAADSGSKISCWAIGGNSFELKSPCPRCAYLYPSWNLYKTQEFHECSYILTYLSSGKGEAKDDNQFHCAETVGAAQVHAWRHESLGFR